MLPTAVSVAQVPSEPPAALDGGTQAADAAQADSPAPLAPEPAPAAELPAEAAAEPAEPAAPETPQDPPYAAPAQAPVEVVVKAKQRDGERLQQSAEAVNVVDLTKAKQQTVDLGEVLARTQGVAVRRDGGLGSNMRFALNGIEQIRFFLDGVPFELAGFPFGIVNVPVNLVQRVEVYRGVVPIRFGADALGGAVNLVSNPTDEGRASVSYQLGSFGTHRLTLEARYKHEPTGLIAGGSGFFDVAKNNYKILVDVPDDSGTLSPRKVTRSNDRYLAYGGTIELGVVDRPWAKRLLLRGYVSAYDKEVPHNTVMTVPYGEVEYGESVWGTTARYEVALHPQLELELLASYAHRSIAFHDLSRSIYSWYGERIGMRRYPGELESGGRDQTTWQDSAFGRMLATWSLAPGHTLRASVTPTFATRTGEDRLHDNAEALDPFSARHDMLTVVSGLEYELSVLDDRLSNVLFVKDYYYDARSQQPTQGGREWRDSTTTDHTQGIGDSLRFRFTPWLFAKASYEFATRLPRPDEVFGDGALVRQNLELQPEISHNGNVGPRVELRRTRIGDITLDINAFVRDTDQLIVLLGGDRYYFMYQNVYKARGLGLENALSWSSPRRYLTLDGMLTWQDVRNVSTERTFGKFNGDRVPNRPYMFASWGARVRIGDVFGQRNTLEPFYNGRYVHKFYRGWESQGLRDFKQTVDSQVTHSLGVTWLSSLDFALVTLTAEVDNLTDARVYDNFGVQRPGRAFYLKLGADFR